MPAENLTVASTEDAPPPPPPMPEADAPPPPAEMPAPADPKPQAGTQQPTSLAAPAGKPDGWQVDSYELRAFTDAVVRARSYLDTVQAKVDRMQGAELTPQLGTSPVGQQLANKFDDRLNSADGLRAMLVEAMKRMEDFVTSAEEAARAYQEREDDTVDSFRRHDEHRPSVKHGG
ncbi:hypothetical protein [Actinophytocola oryzae]|uniref:PE family protein n=1 Tax=Actinophytocola oryzae TaxID=502181 RepID=A0A4R7VDT8_9PSEU|nr:hypothetical protein [Actinophytocola oryzae]TDV47159.1 hypothetical protein CLV71_110343 [Actinophytocola oryzae]